MLLLWWLTSLSGLEIQCRSDAMGFGKKLRLRLYIDPEDINRIRRILIKRIILTNTKC